MVVNEDVKNADKIFRETLQGLLTEHYKDKNRTEYFPYFKERDIVWDFQKYLSRLVEVKNSTYKVFTEQAIEIREGEETKKVFCDLVITNAKDILITAEFKYEPKKNRQDSIFLEGGENGKFPVTSWAAYETKKETKQKKLKDGFKRDIIRAREFVLSPRKVKVGYAIFIDEDNYYKRTIKQSQFEQYMGKIEATHCEKIVNCDWGVNSWYLQALSGEDGGSVFVYRYCAE